MALLHFALGVSPYDDDPSFEPTIQEMGHAETIPAGSIEELVPIGLRRNPPIEAILANWRGAELYKQVMELFERIVREERSFFCRLACRVVGDFDKAEDIVQDALIRAYKALGDYDEEKLLKLKMRHWLCKIVWNTAINFFERESKFIHAGLLEDDLYIEKIDVGSEEPEKVLLYREMVVVIGHLVESLPLLYREIIVLHIFEERSYKDIAHLLKRPIKTVRVQLHRGLALLRETLTREIDNDSAA